MRAVESADEPLASDGSEIDLAEGTVQVQITGYRLDGPIPLDPGHPDPWDGRPWIDARGTLVGLRWQRP